MAKYYVSSEVPNSAIIDLNRVVAMIEFIPTPDGKICEELIKTGNFNIVPYGIGEKDENGNVTKYELLGFTILEKKN